MASLIVYAVMFGVLALGIFGAIRSHDNGIRADQKAKDQVLLVAAQDNEKIATDANAKLQGKLKTLGDERQACSDSVAGYELETAAAKASKASAQESAKAAKTELQNDRDMAVRWALTKRPAGQTCEQTLNIIDERLRALAVREFAARPPLEPSK